MTLRIDGLTDHLEDVMRNSLVESIEDLIRKSTSEDEFQEAFEAAQVQVEPNIQALSEGIGKAIVQYVLRDPAQDDDNPPENKTDYAETYSSKEEDQEFWDWLQGFIGAFQNWQPMTEDGLSLKSELSNFLGNVPNQIKGIIK